MPCLLLFIISVIFQKLAFNCTTVMLLLWPLHLVRSVTKPRLRPLYSRSSHQHPVQGCWTCYTVQGINSVQQTVKSPLPPALSKRVGACECGKRIPQAVSFHPASAAAAETGSIVTWSLCALDQLSILGALFHFPASHHDSYPTVCLSEPAVL